MKITKMEITRMKITKMEIIRMKSSHNDIKVTVREYDQLRCTYDRRETTTAEQASADFKRI